MAYFHIVFNLYHTTGLYNSLREKCPNTEFSLVRIFLHSNLILRFSPYSVQMQENTDQKKLHVWTLLDAVIHETEVGAHIVKIIKFG